MKLFTVIHVLISSALLWTLSGNAQPTKRKQPVNLTTLNYSVEAAPEWTDLFRRNTGWFGGDGIYTIPLNGVDRPAGTKSKVLFIFSDSMIGHVTDSTMLPGYNMIHNSVAYLQGNTPDKKHMQFDWQTTAAAQPESVFIPHTPATGPTDYYWLGDGFVNQELNNTLYIFGYRVRNVSDDAFGFREVGNTLIKFPASVKLPQGKYQQFDTPLYFEQNGSYGSFGAGIYVNTRKAGAPAADGYIYVYGVKGINKALLVARVHPASFEKFAEWRYWDGKQWGSDISKAATVTESVSNELSLSALPDGRYALIFQIGGMGTGVGMRIGASPAGPFGPIIQLWDCKPDLKETTYVVYNAKAHPAISAPGELLISYNINSVAFIKDLNKDPHLYRPRFIRLKFK